MKEVINIFFEICEKKYETIMFVAFFILFGYVYNIGLKEYIFPNQILIFGAFIIASILIVCANYQEYKRKKIVNSKNKYMCIVVVILLFLITFRNGDLINKHFGSPFYTIYAIFLIFSLSFSDRWYKSFKNVIVIFTLEHIVATIFCYAFPQIYLEYILPIFPESARAMLLGQYNAGEIAGITQHYSTNALYLVVGFIILFFEIDFSSKSKKNIFYIVMLIVNFFALLLTGKRVQVIFSIITILTINILNGNISLKRKKKKIFMISGILIVFFIVLAIFVPNIITPFKRTWEGFQKGDMFNSRKPLYELAISEFREHPFIGIGWGNYKYEYSQKVFEKEMDLMDTHNIYLQLLCETGVLGFTFFMTLFTLTLVKGLKAILNKKNKYCVTILSRFIAFECYFLIEGFFGNTLYDIMIFLPFSCLIGLMMNYLIYKEKNIMIEEKFEK